MATQQEQWQQVKDLVAEHLGDLKQMDHTGIKDFATENGVMTKSGFPKLKTVLKTKGINYEALREQAFEQREQKLAEKAETLGERAADGPEVFLASAAVENDGQASFAVVDAENQAVWYGKLFPGDHEWVPGDPIAAEQSAAAKAVWIAGKTLAHHGAEAGRLVLSVTHPELDTDSLVRAGVRHNLEVTISFDEDNAAVDMAQTPGYQKWQEYDLAQLIGGDE